MIRNNFVKKENVLSGEKGFEDQFTDETIIDAFKTYCKNFNLEKIERNANPIYEYIRKKYYAQTQKSINKPSFGLALVNSAIKNGTLGDTLIHQFLVRNFVK